MMFPDLSYGRLAAIAVAILSILAAAAWSYYCGIVLAFNAKREIKIHGNTVNAALSWRCALPIAVAMISTTIHCIVGVPQLEAIVYVIIKFLLSVGDLQVALRSVDALKKMKNHV